MKKPLRKRNIEVKGSLEKSQDNRVSTVNMKLRIKKTHHLYQK